MIEDSHPKVITILMKEFLKLLNKIETLSPGAPQEDDDKNVQDDRNVQIETLHKWIESVKCFAQPLLAGQKVIESVLLERIVANEPAYFETTQPPPVVGVFITTVDDSDNDGDDVIDPNDPNEVVNAIKRLALWIKGFQYQLRRELGGDAIEDVAQLEGIVDKALEDLVKEDPPAPFLPYSVRGVKVVEVRRI
jgi:hypothetical protein